MNVAQVHLAMEVVFGLVVEEAQCLDKRQASEAARKSCGSESVRSMNVCVVCACAWANSSVHETRHNNSWA